MTATASARLALLHRALQLEYLTVGWNIVEGLVAIWAAAAAGSVALLGFGIDQLRRVGIRVGAGVAARAPAQDRWDWAASPAVL